MSPAGGSSAEAARSRSAGVDATIESLSDPLRRRAVEVLSDRSLRSGELARELGVSPSTMSKHLRVLRRSGLLEERADDLDARVRIYSLRSAPMVELRRWLARAEAGWSEQLRSFKEYVEADHIETEHIETEHIETDGSGADRD